MKAAISSPMKAGTKSLWRNSIACLAVAAWGLAAGLHATAATVSTTNLPTATSIAATDTVVANISGVTKKAPVSLLLPAIRTLNYDGSGNVLVDLATGNAFKVLLTNNATLLFSNITSPTWFQNYTLITMQNAAGTWGVTFGTNAAGHRFMFSGGIAPTITTNAGAQDVLSMVISYYGTNLDAVLSPNFK